LLTVERIRERREEVAETAAGVAAAKVTAVVPAYNEAGRVSRVLDALAGARSVHEVIVVDDGSLDDTSSVAGAHPSAQGEDATVRVLRHSPNRGKGAAMRTGADAAYDADVLLFLDADLIGITSDQIDALVAPVASGQAGMSLGIFRGGRGATTLAQFLAPNISGQRAIRRELFLSIPCLSHSGYGVELAITNHVLGEGVPMKRVPLQDVTHPMKEEKLGMFRGFASRLRMYRQMLPYIIRGRRKRRGTRR